MKAIVAVDRNWGIGRNNNLLFRIPADMKFFRETTAGKVVVMGLNTLRSFPGGKPLPNRVNLVLSDVQLPEEENLTVCRSLEELRSALSRLEYPGTRSKVKHSFGEYCRGRVVECCVCIAAARQRACSQRKRHRIGGLRKERQGPQRPFVFLGLGTDACKAQDNACQYFLSHIFTI